MPVVVPSSSAAADRGAAPSTVGRSKAGAKGLALLAATLRRGVLKGLVGTHEMERICDVISLSLTGQVASLHVPPLPDNSLDALVGALGLRSDCREDGESRGRNGAPHARSLSGEVAGGKGGVAIAVAVAVAIVCLKEDDNTQQCVPGGGAIEGGGGLPQS